VKPGRQSRRSRNVKYHPGSVLVLTLLPVNPGSGHFQPGSLTGAVSSQKVTEESKGTLGLVGNQALERKGIRVLDCETHKSSRCESRA
jgi:hypothetical protein